MKTKVLSVFATVLFCISLIGNINAASLENTNLNTYELSSFVGGVVIASIIQSRVIEVKADGDFIKIARASRAGELTHIEITQEEGGETILEASSSRSVTGINTRELRRGVYQMTIRTDRGGFAQYYIQKF